MRIFLLVIFFSIQFAGAATYYVDFDGGSDAAAGTSTGTAWKHCRGDANATGTAGTGSLAAGDTVNFKGGVRYKGIVSATASGTSGSYITYDGAPSGWGTGSAIIDGTTNLSFTVCSAQGTNTTQVNNASFASIYYATIPASFDWAMLVMEDDAILGHAGSANTENSFGFEDTDYFQAVSSGVTSTTITDASFLNQTDPDYWKGSLVMAHVTGNAVGFSSQPTFDTATDTLTFASIGTVYQDSNWDNKYHYSVMNAQPQLVRGSYVVDEVLDRILVWPTNNVANVRVAFRTTGFHLGGSSYLKVRNFQIEGMYGTTYEPGRLITASTSTATDGNIIENNTLRWAWAGGATASVYTHGAGTSNNVIRNNQLSYLHCRGLFGTGHILIQSNDCGPFITGTVLYSQAPSGAPGVDIQFLDNYLHDNKGVHANGMTVYGGTASTNYYSTNIYIARNRVIRQYHRYGPFALSLQAYRGAIIENNVLDGNIGDDGPKMAPKHWWLNNTITGSLRIYGAAEVDSCIVKNNILMNGLINNTGESWGDIDYQYNIYTNLTWRQEAGYGWTIGAGESITTIAAIYAGGFTDGTITAGSAAYNTGTDISATMVNDLDAILTVRPQASLWDIGAYEYQAGGGSSSYQGFSFGNGVKLIGPGRLTQ